MCRIQKKQNDTGELEDPSIWFTDSKCVCVRQQNMEKY